MDGRSSRQSSHRWKGVEDTTDGIQGGLVRELRDLAGENGLAFVVREHDYFKDVFFPVASSWSPPIAPVEIPQTMATVVQTTLRSTPQGRST